MRFEGLNLAKAGISIESPAGRPLLTGLGRRRGYGLRTLVRHITGFSNLLRREAGPITLKATHFLSVIDDAAGQMNVLIDAMLELSRTARLPLRIGSVDLKVLVMRGRQALEVEEQGRDVRWQVSPLPLVNGDHDTLQQVITNLLSNAVKYTRPRAAAIIEVWAEERAREWAVFVRDNGVGFDPRYQQKLFGVFQRLHLEREFEGTGVGLANVRCIIPGMAGPSRLRVPWKRARRSASPCRAKNSRSRHRLNRAESHPIRPTRRGGSASS